MGQCLLAFVIIALLNIAIPSPAIADSGRASLRHIDAGKSIPEKLSNAKVRSQKRLEALKSSLTSFSLHGRQLDTTYRSKILYAEEYLMEVQVGTPAKNFTAILDTGSDIVWFKCSPCSACESADSSCKSCPPTVLDSSQSTSFSAITCNSTQCSSLPEIRSCSEAESNTCDYHYAYADESYNNGQYVSEALSLLSDSGPSEPFDVVLGCAHTLTGDFSGGDGLVGFGMGSSSFISQIPSLDGKFSYCLTSYAESNDSVLLLGNSSVISDSSVMSTPILQSSSQLYYVKLKSISVGNNTLISHSNTSSSADINPAGTIFDSGTTFTYLHTNLFNSVKDAFVNALPDLPVLLNYEGFDVCFNMSGDASSVQFPSLSFQFDGALLSPPQRNYMAFADNAETIKCLLLTPADDGLGIIGNFFQQNYLVAHDTTGMKLSFLEKNCNDV